MSTFAQLRSNVYADLGYEDPPLTAVVVRVSRHLNEGYRELFRQPFFASIGKATLPLTTVAGRGVYGLPMVFERIDRIAQASNFRKLEFKTREWFRAVDPGERSSGNPDVWIPEGVQPVMLHPNSTGVWVASSDASDITAKARVITVRANGDVQPIKEANINGLTRVVIGNSLTDVVRIVSWTLDRAQAGDISLYDAATAGNELGRIVNGSLSVRYQGIRLWPTPAAALTYTVDGRLAPPQLVADDDTPLLPESYHDLLQAYARSREYERTRDDRYGLARSTWDNGLLSLKSAMDFPDDWSPVAGRRLGRTGVSNLGAWYPADLLR